MATPGTGQTSVRTYHFHRDTTLAGGGGYADNGPYPFIDEIDTALNFTSHTLQFFNDGAADLFYSFDGVNDAGRVLAGENYTQPYRREKRIWFRGTAGQPYRFYAW